MLIEEASMSSHHGREVARGERFGFGDNWSRFLSVLNEERIRTAEESLRRMLGVTDLVGRTFLDVGSGSGLFSLAARRMGASVHSFDYDPQSVACALELKRRYFDGDADWRIEEASVLDSDYLERLGQFDVVYAWGVLHHTGAMWTALSNVAQLVNDQGQLFVAIYNDQGGQSRRWRLLKRIYNKLPDALKLPYTAMTMGVRELKFLAISTVKGHPAAYFRHVRDYQRQSLRGMSYWHDVVDWIGGYPFEVAKPEEIIDLYHARSFQLRRIKTNAGGLGCNEYVFVKVRQDGRAP
jgi:2-polyprenyl-6-hydroxyphenyl methylase/3-demethylubiquinone-9 3-methyltransferase